MYLHRCRALGMLADLDCQVCSLSSVCVRVCVCVCVCVRLSMCMCVCVRRCRLTDMCACVCVCPCVRVSMCAWLVKCLQLQQVPSIIKGMCILLLDSYVA